MLNLTQYGMDITRTSLVTNDLIVIANIDKRNNVDTRVSEIGVDYISIEGKYENVTGYAMIGSDLVKIVSSEIIESNTKLTIEKGQYGVKGTFTVGSHFRTVVVVDDDSDIQLLSWEFEDTTSIGSFDMCLYITNKSLSGIECAEKIYINKAVGFKERVMYKAYEEDISNV